jgi:hypothetical protein
MIETQISIDSVFRRQRFNNNVHLAARLQLPAFLVHRSNNGTCAIIALELNSSPTCW